MPGSEQVKELVQQLEIGQDHSQVLQRGEQKLSVTGWELASLVE